MISIVIPAHNEGSVIARTLGVMIQGAAADELEVIVVCNGCTDDTAAVARRFGSPVQVIETATASKTHALNLGDRIARGFPRIYADADILLTLDAIRALAGRLDRGDVLASAPRARIETTGCSWLVRAYFGIRSRLPSSREGIGGSGVYALSETGRQRFGEFPKVTADDAFVRVQFRPQERETLDHVTSTVFAPHTIRRLISVRSRVYFGMLELRRRFPHSVNNIGGSNRRTLIALLGNVNLWPGLAVYCGVCTIARLRAGFRRRGGPVVWQRDDTSRSYSV